MTQWAKLSETEWAKFPDDWTPDQIKAAIQRVRAPKVDHAARLASMKAGVDIPPGVDLETPPDVSYKERVTGRLNRASAAVNRDITTPISNEGGGRAMLGELVKRGLDILGQYGSAMMSVPAAGVEKVARLRNRPGDMAGPEVEEYARGAGDFADQVLQQILALGMGKKGFKYEPRPPKVGIAPKKGPEIKLRTAAPELVEDLETGAIIEPNAPPTPDRAAKVKADLEAAGIDPADPISLDATLAEEKGIPPATKITVGETPVSKTTIDGDNVQMDLATGEPHEVIHEKLHHEAEVKGTPHPPEDNNAILDTEDRLINSLYNRERTDPMLRETQGPEFDVDPDAATGPYPRRPAEAPISDPGQLSTTREMPPPEISKDIVGPKEESIAWDEPLPDQLGGGKEPRIPRGPDIDRSIIGPKEKAMLDHEPPPPDLETYSGGEDKAREARTAITERRAAKAAKRAKAEDEAAAASIYDKVKKAFSDVVDFGNVMMTSRPRTAARNIRTQAVALAVDNVDTWLARKIQRAMGAEQMPSSLGAWEEMFKHAKENKQTWDMIANLNQEGENLLESYMSAEKGARFSNPVVDKVASAASYLNNAQEGWTRRGVAINYLEQIAQKKAGLSLREIIDNGTFPDVIKTEDIAASIKHAREVTFSMEPTNKTVKWLLQGRQSALVRAIQPFMRFSYNSGRFIYHHSPFIAGEIGFKSLTNPEYLKALKAGDPEIIKNAAQAMTGTMGFVAGIVGAKAMLDQDSIEVLANKINIKPENPLSGYLVAGFLTRRALMKDPAPLYEGDIKWIMAAVLNSSQRVEASEQLNQLMSNILTESGRAQVTETRLRELTGQWLARYSLLGQSASAILSLVDPELATLRDTSEHLYDPTIANIPFVNKTLPKRYGTDYAGPVVVQNPVAGEVSGISFEKQGGPVNKEMELYQVRPRYNVFPGEPKWNNEYRKTVMEKIDEMGTKLINSEEYKKADPDRKRFLLEQVRTSASNVAKTSTMKDMPDDLRKQFLVDRQTEMLMRD